MLDGTEFLVATHELGPGGIRGQRAPPTLPIGLVTADGAYDGEPVYRAAAERQPDSPVATVTPPR